jgi:hypothetical protein
MGEGHMGGELKSGTVSEQQHHPGAAQGAGR